METGTIVIIVIAAILVLIALYMVGVFNKLVNARNKVQNQFSQIDVQLKKRFDLIPNLVETVKGYAKHEKETLDAVINARNRAVSAQGAEAEMKANGELSGALSKLFALAESYSDLKANTNFMDLQSNLKDTEDKISYARQFYNDAVLKYKNKLEVFPSNIVAGMFGFKPEPFFEATGSERENVKVQF